MLPLIWKQLMGGNLDNSYQKREPMTLDPSPTPWRLALSATVLFVAIFAVDLLLPLGVAGGVPYVAVVLLGWWFPKRNQTIILAAISTALILIGYLYSPEGGIPWVVASNRFLALFAIWVSATLLVMAKKAAEKVKKANEELEQRVEERTRKLRESEALFKDISEASTDRFWETDETHRFTSMFDHSESAIFPAAGEFIGRTRWEAAGVNPDEDEKWGKHRDDLLAHRTFRDFQFAITDEDGINCYLSASGKPFFDEEGNFRGYRGSATDITERKQAEEALQSTRILLEKTFASQTAAIFVVDMPGRMIRTCNPATEKMFGYPINEILGEETAFLYVDEEHSRKFGEMLMPALDDFGVFETEFEMRRKDGTVFPADHTVSEIRNEQGERTQVVSVVRDITERKQAEEGRRIALIEAEQANEAKSEFLATMSHELRTPLNAILGFSDILGDQYFGPPGEGKYKEYADDIHASGEHLLELVNDLLDISTIEAGKQSLVKEKLSTDGIIRECARIITEKARSKGIELVTKVSENLPPLYADRRAMKQILFNLLSNSIKFTPEGGRITVSAKASKRNTTLKIADTGTGIPAEKLPQLTNPFTRGEQDPHKAQEGIGLGLAITKSLVDLHDGTLDIKSKVGKGTTVTVTLSNVAS